jgi:hypothetical protein
MMVVVICVVIMMNACFVVRAVDLFLSNWIWCVLCPLGIWQLFVGHEDSCHGCDLKYKNSLEYADMIALCVILLWVPNTYFLSSVLVIAEVVSLSSSVGFCI